MSKKEKSISIIEFLGKKTDWENWSENFLSCGKWKGYKNFLVSNRSTSGVDKNPTQDEYESVMGQSLTQKNSVKFLVSSHNYYFLK